MNKDFLKFFAWLFIFFRENQKEFFKIYIMINNAFSNVFFFNLIKKSFFTLYFQLINKEINFTLLKSYLK